LKKIFVTSLFALPICIWAQKKDTVIKEREIEEVVFQKRNARKNTDLTTVKLSAKEAQQIASISGGIEGLIKTLPSVNSNTELSSQYMVRGGSYDENLIYINDIEIYRPFNSQFHAGRHEHH
jgi:hypothetical protein